MTLQRDLSDGVVTVLATDTDWQVATLLIHPENERSLALAHRAGFDRVDDLDGNPYWKQVVSTYLE